MLSTFLLLLLLIVVLLATAGILYRVREVATSLNGLHISLASLTDQVDGLHEELAVLKAPVLQTTSTPIIPVPEANPIEAPNLAEMDLDEDVRFPLTGDLQVRFDNETEATKIKIIPLEKLA